MILTIREEIIIILKCQTFKIVICCGTPLKPAYITKFALLSAVGVSKAINQFKANRQTLSSQKQQQNPEQQKQITDKNDEKVKKLVKATNDEKLEKAKRERKKYTKAI